MTEGTRAHRRTGRSDRPKNDAAAWPQLEPRTLVDRVLAVIVAQAARGVILPNDRIVESDLARRLGVSRVPIREALRRLESQGVVTDEPYRGIRLTPVTNRRVRELIEARATLEITAAHAAVDAGRHGRPWTDRLRDAVLEMERTAEQNDAYGLAAMDTEFHRAMCRLGDNEVLLDLWQTLAQQITIIFGLATTGRPMPAIVAEHHELLNTLESGNKERIARTLHQHITVMNLAVDFEAIVEQRRRSRQDGTRG